MQNIWEAVKNYYVTLGKNYHVDPVIYLGIHIVATPLFVITIAWIIKNYKQKKSIVLPVFISILLFNAANVYLAIFGKQIPWWIYAIVITTTLISGYYSYKKIRNKMKLS